MYILKFFDIFCCFSFEGVSVVAHSINKGKRKSYHFFACSLGIQEKGFIVGESHGSIHLSNLK